MTGPRADWPATAAPTYRQIAEIVQPRVCADRAARRRTVAGMWWYAVIEYWAPADGYAELTVYEYPTERPDGGGKQVWGCVLQGVARVEDLRAAADRRLEPTAYERIGEWRQDGDRWLARVAVANLP